MNAAIPRVLLGLILILSPGCSTAGPAAWFPFTWPAADDRTVPRPDGEAREGESKAARETPDRTSRERLGDPADTLYRLGLQQADPTSGIRDYRAARATFTRLLSEHPHSRWHAEARAWQATLTDLLRREDEARQATQQWQRSDQESKRLKTNLERLKRLELDQEDRR